MVEVVEELEELDGRPLWALRKTRCHALEQALAVLEPALALAALDPHCPGPSTDPAPPPQPLPAEPALAVVAPALAWAEPGPKRPSSSTDPAPPPQPWPAEPVFAVAEPALAVAELGY